MNSFDKNLHGDNEFGFAEFTNKREKITEAIKLSVKDDYVIVGKSGEGLVYSLNERGREIVTNIQSPYSKAYCQVNDRSVDDVIAQVKQIVGDMPVYLTFDIDCLDPAFAPGTGTPVIGGLTSDRAIKLVRGLKDLNIVGMDVVEVAPAYDQSEITALAAATLALEMLYIQAAKKGE